MTVHPQAAGGFGQGADRYERARPDYPDAALDLLERELGVGPGCHVLDLAAGTGKLTRRLVASGADVVAVEPLAAMREELAVQVRAASLLEGTAEAIPLSDGSVDVVTVAQAFHWFHPRRALAEVARVLRPGGGLAVLANERDESVPWVAELSRIIHWPGPDSRVDPTADFGAVIDAIGGFTPTRRATFAFSHEVDVELLVERVLSSSYIATMPEVPQQELLAQVRDLVAGFPPRFDLPYVCTVHWCHQSSTTPS